MKKRIGIVGTAETSRRLAPFKDPSWEFWLMGPAWQDEGNPMRWDRWFEIHPASDFDPAVSTQDPGYFDWLSKVDGKPIYMPAPLDSRIKSAVEFPMDRLMVTHGGFFLDSTIAWMMAYIHDDLAEEVEEVGFWGVDFGNSIERIQQKKGFEHFKKLLKEKGIKVTIPPESDMAFDREPYPFSSGYARKIAVQKKELELRRDNAMKIMASLENQVAVMKKDLAVFDGYIQALEWFETIT